MAINICIFEDENYKNFLPLNWTRPTYDLICGITSLWEKIVSLYPGTKVSFLCRDYVAPIFSSKGKLVNSIKVLKGGALFLNGRWLPLSGNIEKKGDEELGIVEDELLYARLNGDTIEKISSPLSSFVITREVIDALKKSVKIVELKSTDYRIIKYPWNLVLTNGKAITYDFKKITKKKKIEGFLDKRVAIYGDKKNLIVEKEAEVQAGVVIDLRDGPVYVGRGAKIRPPTIIDGPSYIGDKSIIDGAKIRTATTIGKVCRIGGEVEESIFYGYSNKHHEGFLGHGYIGEWVNLGALTTNSDLKNNYGNVKVYVNGELTDTGEIKVGCFIADHTKTGIGTMINTGSVFGVACNIFGTGIPPKFVPSFSWGEGKNFVEHDPEIAIKNAKKIMARRKIEQTEEDAELLRRIYNFTAEERNLAGIKKVKI